MILCDNCKSIYLSRTSTSSTLCDDCCCRKTDCNNTKRKDSMFCRDHSCIHNVHRYSPHRVCARCFCSKCKKIKKSFYSIRNECHCAIFGGINRNANKKVVLKQYGYPPTQIESYAANQKSEELIDPFSEEPSIPLIDPFSEEPSIPLIDPFSEEPSIPLIDFYIPEQYL